MNVYRGGLLLLCFCLGVLLCLIYFKPSKGINPEGNPKVSTENAKLSSSQVAFKNVAKSIGEIQARLQTLENKMEQINKEKKDSVKDQVKSNKVNPNVNRVPGEIMRDEKCFDSFEHGDGGEIVVIQCHKQGGNQLFMMEDGNIKHKNYCLSVEKAKSGATVVLKDCDQAGWIQEWQYHDKTLKAAESEYCMENSGDGAVKLEQCNAENKSQHWYMAS